MRKSLLIIMIALLAIPTAFAARKKDKAGEVVDYVYTDNKYNFSLTLNEEWKYKIQKDKSSFRMSLNQINYAIPPDYASIPDYTKIPRMVLFVVETSLSPAEFLDSLVSDTYESEVKKEVLKECEILNMNSSTGFDPEKVLTRKKKALKINDNNGYYWTGQLKYTNEVSTSASSQGGKRVKGGYGGGLVSVEIGDKMVLFHVISELNYFDAVFEEALKIINTLKTN